MTLVIVILMLLGYLLICLEHVTRVNKATIAMFCGVVGWVLFMCVGPYYVDHLHGVDFHTFLDGAPYSVRAVNEYIANNIFVKHLLQICSIVMYLLATASIVELLLNNECFSFVSDWCRSKSSTRMAWSLALFSFLLSANMDNLTSCVVMLMILRGLVINPKQRMLLGSIVVIATNCGGCFTVIGDVSSLLIWTRGVVTPSNYSGALILPALVATVVPTYLIAKKLPATIDLKRSAVLYRGDTALLPVWQRLLMLIVGICGLWFVPTFNRLTLLPPFLGALCVLGVLWVVNEVVNRKRILSDQPLNVSHSSDLQYEVTQMTMFFVGICLCVDVLVEVGAMEHVASWCDEHIHNTYLMSLFVGFVSSVMDNIALVMSGISVYSVQDATSAMSSYELSFAQNGQYWHLIALSGCVGGCLLPIGNVAGHMLMKKENVSLVWYIRHITLKVFAGWLLALGVYFVVDSFLR